MERLFQRFIPSYERILIIMSEDYLRDAIEEYGVYEPPNYDLLEQDFIISTSPYVYSDDTKIESFADSTKYSSIYHRLESLTVQDVRKMSFRQLRNALRIEPEMKMWNEHTEKQVRNLDEELDAFVQEYLTPLLRRPALCEMIHDEYFGSSNEHLPAVTWRCSKWVCEHSVHIKDHCVQCGGTICLECGGGYTSVYCKTDGQIGKWQKTCQFCNEKKMDELRVM